MLYENTLGSEEQIEQAAQVEQINPCTNLYSQFENLYTQINSPSINKSRVQINKGALTFLHYTFGFVNSARSL